MESTSTKGTANYPYWSNEFADEFKGLEVLYVEEQFYNKEKKRARTKYIDTADSYRVFMILCNNNYNMSRMEVLNVLKNATEENPVIIQNEIFWTEKS